MKIKMQKKFLKCNSKKEYTNKSKHLKNEKTMFCLFLRVCNTYSGRLPRQIKMAMDKMIIE